jgi:acetyl-CoA carboxylase biotin carboxyl carrier protein
MAPPRKTSKRTPKNSAASSSSGKTSIESKPVKRPAGKAEVAAWSGEHPTVAMVRGLAEIVETHSLSELIVEMPDATLTLRRAAAAPPVVSQPSVVPGPTMAPVAAAQPAAPVAAPPAPRPAAPALAAPADDHHVVTSPFVGTFYCRPNPDADPYVTVSGRVEKGQVLCIIEAMKLMNEIEADISGTVVAILAADAEPVEFGQPLFKIARS